MNMDFEKYAMKGNEFMHLLEDNLEDSDRAHAGRILRSVFHVLRNHLTIEESFQLIAQLPMAIKAVYVDGWTLRTHKRVHTINEFLNEILAEDGGSAWRDFSSRDEIIAAVRAVIMTMNGYVSSEELLQALNTLPSEIFETLTAP